MDAAFEDRTDWKRLRDLTDAEIDEALAGDDESYALNSEELAAHRDERFAYQIYRAEDRQWHWRLVDRSGRILAQSHDGLPTRKAVQKALADLRFAVLGAQGEAP